MEPQYVILELLGHRQRAGWLSEEEIAGAGFLRLDIPQEGDPPMRTEWYATAAVYSIHPATEARVRQYNLPPVRVALSGYQGAEERENEIVWDALVEDRGLHEDEGQEEWQPIDD